MEELYILLAAILLLVVFRRNRFVKPFADILFSVAAFLVLSLIGGIGGFTVAYFKYAKVESIDVPLEFIFSDEPYWGRIFLGPIRDRIILYTVWGVILGAFISLIWIWIVRVTRKQSNPTSARNAALVDHPVEMTAEDEFRKQEGNS